MKKIKGFIAIFVVFILATVVYFSTPKNNEKFVQNKQIIKEENSEEPEYKIIYEESPQKEFLNLEEQIYNAEYERGRKSMYKQMGVLLIDKNEKNFDYTVLKEAPEEEKNKYEEIMAKAYADGYHKASESFYCPRQEY